MTDDVGEMEDRAARHAKSMLGLAAEIIELEDLRRAAAEDKKRAAKNYRDREKAIEKRMEEVRKEYKNGGFRQQEFFEPDKVIGVAPVEDATEQVNPGGE
ncbi:MAG: hypothetical protein GY851_35515 [bacterium]|nr:hypothetical protein [bacterium]